MPTRSDDQWSEAWEDTRAEWLNTARYVDANYQSPFGVGDRPITNVEMMADQLAETIRAREAIDQNGCCGKGRWSDGVCRVPGIGICPRFAKAEEMSRHAI